MINLEDKRRRALMADLIAEGGAAGRVPGMTAEITQLRRSSSIRGWQYLLQQRDHAFKEARAAAKAAAEERQRLRRRGGRKTKED